MWEEEAALAQKMLSGRRASGGSKNKNKLFNSGESQDLERRESPHEPQDMCCQVK